MSMLGAGNSITIANPGWHNPVIAPISGPSASWEVSGIGHFSCHIPSRRAHYLGFDDLKGKWLRFDHPTMGVWGGQIRRNPTDGGTMEISADSFAIRLKGILTPITLKTATGTPGQLALYLITNSPTDRRLGFDSMDASASGRVIQLDLRGDDLFDVIDSLASQNDHEYNVTVNDDGTIEWEFRHRIGRDMTGSVILSEGWNVLTPAVAPTIDPVVNHILAIPDDQDWINAPKKVVIDPDSIIAYERQAESRRYSGTPGRAGLATRANLDLMLESKPAIPATLTVRENDVVNNNIREGDTVRYWSADQDKRYFFRVKSRSVEDGLAKYAGDCVDEDDQE